MQSSLFLGADGAGAAQCLALNRANRHGLIAGATGTGKTVTLQIMAEGFSQAGVPVFCVDVKGDLSGLAAAGSADHRLHDKLQARAAQIGLSDYGYNAAPCVFWDVFGRRGHPVRVSVSEFGPELLGRLLGLNDTQTGVLTLAEAFAEDENLLLLDLKDVRALLGVLVEQRAALSAQYGHYATASVGAIQRRLLALEQAGAEAFFGEPALSLDALMGRTASGAGLVSVLDATKLIREPLLYASFLTWLLAELFEDLPEIGDPDKPVLALFFDEAHLMFDDAPKALVDQIEQVVRLVRSKGVGVYFVTQNPRDLPDPVLAQLGCRVQHALRAYTPKERRALKAAADSFRPNPKFDAEEAIPTLGVGEALVSTLDASGAPTPVARTLIRPPSSRLCPLTDEERAAVQAQSPFRGQFDTAIDRASAYERLEQRRAELARRREPEPTPRRAPTSRSRSDSVARSEPKSALTTATTLVVREVMRGFFRRKR
ncbi:MAG: helicase HerA-like domain-containing protein [Maricaulaceae bacterium]